MTIDQRVRDILNKHKAAPIHLYDWACKNPVMKNENSEEAQEHVMINHFSGFCMEKPDYFICEECSREIYDEGVLVEEVTKWPCDVWNLYSLITDTEITIDEDW